MFKVYHYIIIQLLHECIMIIEHKGENFDNTKMIESVSNSMHNDKLIVYLISDIDNEYDNLPEMVQDMIDDMDNENKKNKMNYIIHKFENNTQMEEYIEKMKSLKNKLEEKVIEVRNEEKIEITTNN